MYLIHYRAIGGKKMPKIANKTLEQINEDYRLSITPVVEAVKVTSDNVDKLLRRMRTRQKRTKPGETGLLWNLKHCIADLEAFKNEQASAT